MVRSPTGDFQGWSEVYSVDQSYFRGIANGASSGTPIVNLEALVVVAPLDRASIKIADASLKGDSFNDFQVEFVTSTGTYLRYELLNAQVVSYDVLNRFTDDGRLLHAYSLTFDRIEVCHNDIGLRTDLGDAPAPFPTLLADDGAYHLPVGPILGELRDVELDGAPDIDALGDDASAADDEDGVMFGSVGINSAIAALNLTASQAAKVDAWVDFNQDGDWNDLGEHILQSRNVAAGLQTLNFQVPVGVVAGETFARVRLSNDGGLTPFGFADSGEVEDYQVNIQASVLPVEVESVEVNNGDNSRSILDRIEIEFNQLVTAPDEAFVLRHRRDDQVITETVVSRDDTSGKSVFEITFVKQLPQDMSYVEERASGNHSLVDGNYDLTVDAGLVHGISDGPIAMAVDHVFGSVQNDKLFRFFSDDDGDRDVDADDLNSFANTFRLDSTYQDFDPSFDIDGDNDVDADDLNAFASRFRNALEWA